MACLSPFYGQVKGSWVPFPCGRCPPCKKRRVDTWVFRLMQEYKRSTSAHFVTLTYDSDHVPISPNGFLTLDKLAFPLYMKRLRKLSPDFSLKYYACGEYGGNHFRPHYHAIIFNCPSDGFFFDAWKLQSVHFGTVHVGQCTSDSVAYCMKYIDKPGRIPCHARDDRVPEFSLMSKGLGSNYVTPAIVKYHNADISRMGITKEDGHVIAMPRYYRFRIFDEDVRAEQPSIIDLAIGRRNSEDYARYLSLYRDSPDFTWDQYVQAKRLGIVEAFYLNQSKRDLT